MSKGTIYAIYELTPAPWGDRHRYIKAFDTRKDAEYVLKALESVNTDYSVYRIMVFEDAFSEKEQNDNHT